MRTQRWIFGYLVAITTGVAMAERSATTEGRKVPRYHDHANLMVWRDASGKQHPVKTPADVLSDIARIELAASKLL